MAIDPVSLTIQAALMAANMALTASQKFEGPRLDDLNVTTSDYGAPLNYLYGIRRFDGVSCIWAEPLREVKRQRKTKGGKFNEYTYYGTWAVAVCDQPVDAITRIWFDRNLVYDATGAGPISPFSALGDINQFMTFYLGTEDQEPDPRMAATIDAEFGDGSTPAYRGVTYVVFKDLPLEKLGNRLPQVTVEAVTAGGTNFPYERFDQTEQPSPLAGFTYSPDHTKAIWGYEEEYEIWDIAARARMVAGTFSGGIIFHSKAMGSDGQLYVLNDTVPTGTNVDVYPADGIGAPTLFYSFTYPGVAARLLRDGTGAEYVCILSQLTTPGVYAIQFKPTLGAIDGIEIVTDWAVSGYCVDSYGDVWACGHSYEFIPPTATSDLYLQRIVDTGARPGSPSFVHLTSPPTSMTYGRVSMMHANGHFVVSWDHAELYLIEDIGLTIVASRSLVHSGDAGLQFAAAKPDAASIWLDDGSTNTAMEISTADLSTVRTAVFDDWFLSTSDRTIYDPINHALIGSELPDSELVNWYYLDRVAGAGVALSDIVDDISERCGLEPGDTDASDLTQTVQGYSWTQGTGKAILEPLLEAYDSEARPHNFAVEFLRRGGAVGVAIPVADMGAGGAARYTVPTLGDSDLPLKVNLTFADLDADQQPNTALAQRPGAATDSRRELALDGSTLALESDEARQMADGYLRRAWIKAQTYETALTRAYSALEPGDARSLVLDDVTVTAKLARLEFGANGVLTTEWERYAPSVHVATAMAGGAADGLAPSVITVFGYTKGLVLDIPLVADSHEGLILYLAAAPYSPDTPWPGASVFRSDDGVDYDEELGAVASTQAATIGYALSALPDSLHTVWDRASSVSVKLFDGELTSATEAEVANGVNMALIGDEIVRFTTATLVADDTYQLSGFLRGRRGTEWATGSHLTGDRFVLLAGLPRATMGASDVGDDIYTRPTTSGGPDGFPQMLDPFTGASLKPYAPCHLAIENDAGDLILTATRRTRIGGTWRDFQDVPLGEGSEAYVGYVLDAGGTVLRTYTSLTTPTYTYDTTDQAADSGAGETLGIAQVSSTVGAGFRAEIAI